MAAAGLYDLEVTLDGAARVQPKSVFFGPRVFLAAVVK
jgi:hypothetical protein